MSNFLHGTGSFNIQREFKIELVQLNKFYILQIISFQCCELMKEMSFVHIRGGCQ